MKFGSLPKLIQEHWVKNVNKRAHFVGDHMVEEKLLLTFEGRMNEIGIEISTVNVILNKLLGIFSSIFLSGFCQYRFVQVATM